ncbi:hypothetical protein B0H19DRAFT_1062274 [Mycena capillaripes]|nr:hypothetical protein B0H19DRAFT_1062274 [Mycena capillaripes]
MSSWFALTLNLGSPLLFRPDTTMATQPTPHGFDATELIKANRASLEVHNRLETLRTRPQRKAPQRARQLNVRPVAGLSSPWIATPVREEISEPPKKIRRLERPASSRETTTSVLNIRIPVVSQPQNRGSAPRGRPRKNPVLEQAAVNSSFVSTIPAETAYHGVDNRSLSRERPRKTPKKSMSSSHFPLTFPKLYQTLPALELTVLHTSLLPHTTYATDHQDKDKCMVMCDIMPAIPQNLSYEWPASRTGLPTIWSQARDVRDPSLVPKLSRRGVSEGWSGEGIHVGQVWVRWRRKTRNETGRIDDRVADQKEYDISVRALINNCDAGTPLVLLVDDTFLHNRSGMGSVVESQFVNGTQVVRYKFAFRWCAGAAGQDEPWWIKPSGTFAVLFLAPSPLMTQPAIPAAINITGTGRVYQCNTCRNSSPHVYVQNWVCLNPKCSDFWKTPSGRLAGPLDYAPEFWISEKHPTFHLVYDKFLVLTRMALQDLRTDIFKELLFCPPKGIIKAPTGGCADPLNCQMIGIHLTKPTSGTIHHVRGSQLLNGEADQLLELYQTQASAGELLFRRWPLNRCKDSFGLAISLTIYVGGGNQTVPLSEASSAVGYAQRLIQDRLKAALGKKHQFNEVLSVAYLEKQAMAVVF